MKLQQSAWVGGDAGPRASILRCGRRISLLLFLSLVGCGGDDALDAHMRAAREAIDNDAFDTASLQLSNALQADAGNADTRALLAKVALIAGRTTVAERQARAIARLDSSPARGRSLLCEALRARGEFDTILKEFNEDATPDGQTCHATALLHQGAVPDAVLGFNDALDAEPSLRDAHLGLAAVEQALGRLNDSERRLRSLASREPLDIRVQRELAAVLVSAGRLEEAELTLRDAIALPRDLDNYPEWIEANVSLAEVRWRRGEKREAVQDVETLLDKLPSHPLPKYLRALFAYEDGDYRLAREYLRKVLNHVPGHEASEKLSAAADLAQGQFGSAQLPFVDRKKDWSEDPLMVELQSRIFVGMGNAGEAVSIMQALDNVTWSDSASRHLARAHSLNGQFDAANALFSTLLQSDPTNISLQIRAVANLLHEGDLTGADRLMADWPVTNQTQQARSVLRLLRFLRIGDLARAEELAKRRRRDDARDLIALLALAESAERQARRDDAIRWLELAAERNPKAVEPRLLLADYASRRADHAAMQLHAEAILSQQPHNAEALALMGEASLLRGDAYAAIDTLREASRVSRASPKISVALVRAQLASGDFWQARRDIKSAIARKTLSPQTVAGLAIEEHRRGNIEQARAITDDLISLDVTRAVGYELEGDLSLLEGKFADAMSAYERAFRHTPGRLASFKAAIAGHAAGSTQERALDRWLDDQPNDKQMRRVRAALGAGR